MRLGIAGFYIKRTSIVRLKLDSERKNTTSAIPDTALPLADISQPNNTDAIHWDLPFECLL